MNSDLVLSERSRTLAIPPESHSPRTTSLSLLEARLAYYRFWKNFYGISWNMLSLLSIMFSGLTSILVALGFGSGESDLKKYIVVLLPALATVFGSIIIQFRMRESWQLRELGRIDIEELLSLVRQLPDDDSEETRKTLRAVEAKVHKISRAQALQFFSYLAQREIESPVDTSQNAKKDIS